MATGKRVYNFVTRRLLNWSDGEGTEDRLLHEGPGLEATLMADPRVRGVVSCTYALPAKGVGLYVFVESDASEAELRELIPLPGPELLQPVAGLPRNQNGDPRLDVLTLVATNQVDELTELGAREPELGEVLRPIIAERLNLTDRSL